VGNGKAAESQGEGVGRSDISDKILKFVGMGAGGERREKEKPISGPRMLIC